MPTIDRRGFVAGTLTLGTTLPTGANRIGLGTAMSGSVHSLKERPMVPSYFHRFPHIAFDRSTDGVLSMRIHSDGKEFVLTLDAYDELRDAFVALSLDPENKVLLLTGTGDYFIKGADMSTFGDLSAVEPWTIVASKGRRMIQSCIDVDIPVVAAVNGPIPLHSEIAFLADIVIAEENAWFQDPHMLGGVVPGDGMHAIWSELLGINRARTFLMLGKKLEAREAERLGIVAELAHKETVLTRAQEIANTLAGKKAVTLRNARQALTQRFSRIIAEGMAYGWPLEAISALKAAHTSGQ